MKPLILLLLTASTVAASTLTLGASWDGNPPGNFGTLTGDFTPEAGHPDFPAGTYRLIVDGGYSALYGQDVVGFEGDTFCATMVNGCVLNKPGNQPTVLEVYLDRPWHLWGASPALGHSPSTGNQFAFTQTAPTEWRWGFEDLPNGDFDYQDVFGRIQFVRGPVVAIDPQQVVPVPEPTTSLLVLFGLFLTALCGRSINGSGRTS